MRDLKLPCVNRVFNELSNVADWSLLQADKILVLTNAVGAPVEPIRATLLAKALEGKNVKELLSNVGAGGGAPAAGPGPAGAYFIFLAGFVMLRRVSFSAVLHWYQKQYRNTSRT